MKTDLQSYFFADAAYFSEVQAFKGEYRRSEPYTRFIGGLDFYTWPTEHFMIQVNPELISSTQLPQQPGNTENTPRVSYVAYVEQGKGVWTYGPAERPSWRLALGWQYYKDNPHGRIFGDYLFRSLIYPSLVNTSFHKARTQVFGLRVENNPGSIFSQNLFVLSETQRYPFYDISLAYSASAKLGEMLEVGAGVNWVSAIPIRPSRTTPRGGEFQNVPDNLYKEVAFQDSTAILQNGQPYKYIWVRRVGADSGEVVVKDSTGFQLDSNRFALRDGKVAGLTGGTMTSENLRKALQSLSSQESKYMELYPGVISTTHEPYSFAGQIVTMRASFNPLAGKKTILGDDALKIYAEAAILGVKNYPGFYENMRERIPIMFGINLPAFNVLDFLSFEAEYFPSKLPPSWLYRFRANVPQPGSDIEGFNLPWLDAERQKKDDWKWGLSARKTFQGFALWAQGGTDHMHSSTLDESFHDIMSRPSHWYFMTRLVLWTGL